MIAILANSIENAGRFSDNLQLYWNSHGVYQSVSLFETTEEFMDVMTRHKYECAILEGTQELAPLISEIRRVNPHCKIAVITNQLDPTVDNKTALICHDLNVEMVVTRKSLEQPFELISKGLCIV